MDNINDRLKSFGNSKLIDIVKNYRQYNYDTALRNTAMDILKSRGIDETDLKLTGNFENQQYSAAEDLAKSYSTNSNITFMFYGILLISRLLITLVARSSEFLGWTLLIISFLSFVLYFVFLIKSFIAQKDFYKAIEKDLGSGDQFIYFIVGMPLFVLMYFYYRKQMAEEMKLIK